MAIWVSGLAKLSKDNPKLKGLLKRTQKVLQQNSERAKELEMLKAELDAAKAKPPVVLPPSAENPLSIFTPMSRSIPKCVPSRPMHVHGSVARAPPGRRRRVE